MNTLLLILLMLCFVPPVVGVLLEREDWNKGQCPECGKEWVCSGTDLAGDRGYYCKECERSIWISYPWIDRRSKGMTPKEAIKQLEDLQGYVFSETGHLPNDEDEIAISVLIEAFKKIQWIPCSLAKPINSGNYLVTSKGSTWVAEWYNDTWWGIELETRWTDVEAWMPLPEPYKKEGAGNEE